MILKTVSLANMPALTEGELAERTSDWLDALWGKVPEHRLEQACQNAIHEHKGSFPVTCYEILDGYKRIQATTPETPAEYHRPARYCERCYNTGHEHVYDPSGKLLGCRASNTCDHRETKQGEGLWYKLETERQNAGKYMQHLPEEVRKKLYPNVELIAKEAKA